jgi:predicted secreted protein
MTIAFGVALYLMIWWVTLFAVLPFGVRTQSEAGDVVPGTPESAPVRPRLLKTFLVNTVLATLVFAVVWMAMESDWFGYGAVPPAPFGVSP